MSKITVELPNYLVADIRRLVKSGKVENEAEAVKQAVMRWVTVHHINNGRRQIKKNRATLETTT